ncbi:protein ACCELERATED CELL DEATH 6 [Eucalyptus grandis]|uniref:protein ACCELERATED CELL DEATH 6 n=1 Tax=Eucalyptus grandis TaxID=71139 RepID=UPI00192ECF60|nr:protein ACCELERATED CELL DEATH 6 [Eucalyptus grandis]
MDVEIPIEIWSQRQRINNALAASRNAGRQDPAELYAAALSLIRIISSSDVEELISEMERVANQTDLSAIFNFLEPLDDSLLHAAAYYDKDSILRFLLYYVPDRLLAAQNRAGNTPLIVAIMNKSSRTAAMLIRRISDLPVEDKNQILRMTDKVGNNALHMAVRRRLVNVVRHLLNEDMELVYQKNADQKSPLYLALESEEPKIREVLLSLPLEPSRIQGLPPIHGAIMHNRYDIATRILEKDVKLFAMTDSRGKNVFHLAAYMNRPRVFELLIPNIEYLGRQWDMNGEEPIHIASKRGYVDIIEKLSQITRWRSKQGQTVLHIAAKYGRTSLVRYLLRHPKLKDLINEADDDGNTALHMAAMHSQPATLIPLILDKRIKPFLLNHQPSTALDIALALVKREYTLRKQLAVMVLASTCGKSATGNEVFPMIDPDKKKPNTDDVENLIGNRSVVATLVATVTFAAGFAVPGGFNSTDTASKDDRGMATMLDKRMFQAFTICNTIAMFCSMIAVVTLVWAQPNDIHTAIVAYRRSMLPLKIALPAMSAAFLTGITLSVGKLPWLANTIFYFGLVCLLIISVAKLLEDPPLIWSRRRPISIMVSWLVLAYIYLWDVETDVSDDTEEDRMVFWTSARGLPDDDSK